MALVIPGRLHLPSGLVVCVDADAARAAGPSAADERTPCLAHRAVLSAPGVLRDDAGAPLVFDDLALRDAHVLRAIVAGARVVPEAREGFTCLNCGAPFEAAPSELLELAPFVDGELDDADLDAPFDFERAHPIPAVRVAGSIAREIRLAPRTAGDALALFRARPDAPLRVTPAVVAAMGVAALGRERRARVIADALADASDEAFRAITDLYHEAHYPLRLAARHACAACGARNDLDVPLERELGRFGADDDGLEAPGFPDAAAFEAMVRPIAERVYGARGVRAIGLFIDEGPPACDDGGEPLLGSYLPGTGAGDGGVAEAPEIRLYYRSFRQKHVEEGAYSVEEEIRETLDHEVTHHLHHLAGSDPLDDEEREAIARDEVRRVGKREALRRAGRETSADLRGFLRATWPVWLIVAFASGLAWCEGAGPR
jgi:hypothetical protein